MIILYYSCNELARRRQVKRVEKALESAMVAKEAKRSAGEDVRRQGPSDTERDIRLSENLLKRIQAGRTDL